jgi:ABC-type bacteriocin/lantibiotic exporter with double-glycine peptidase domain
VAGDRVGLAALIPYLRQHRFTLAAVAALSLIAAGVALVQPLLIRAVLDGICPKYRGKKLSSINTAPFADFASRLLSEILVTNSERVLCLRQSPL